MANNLNEGDYDQNSLAEKYIALKGLSPDSSTNKRLHIADFDADNVLRLIQRGLSHVRLNMPVECALDIGCGEGNICQFLIKQKLAEKVIGIDRSNEMLNYATANSTDDATRCQYFKADAVSDDLLTIIGKPSPLVVQTYMLPHAESVDRLSRILSNIANVSCGLFVGLLPNSDCDFTGECIKKLLQHGIKYIMPQENRALEDGTKYHLTFELDTPNELTLVDYWYSTATYEKVFRQAGFQFFEWIPVELTRNKDNAFLVDLVNSNAVIGFIAAKA